MNETAQLKRAWNAMAGWIDSRADIAACPFRFPDVADVTRSLGLNALRIAPGTIPLPKSDLEERQPSFQNADVATLRALQQVLNDSPHDDRVSLWSEKLLRTCEIQRLELSSVARRSTCSTEAARLRILMLCLFFLEHFRIHEDPRYVNLVLKLLDQRWLKAQVAWHVRHSSDAVVWRRVLTLVVRVLLSHSLQTLSDAGWQTHPKFSAADLLEPAPQLTMTSPFQGDEQPGVVVFCPNPYSFYTLTVLHLLQLHGVHIQGIAVRRMFNRARILQEFRRDGTRLLKKVWRKLIVRERGYTPRRYMTLPQYMAELGIPHKHAFSWAEKHGIPAVSCNTLNDDHVVELLETNRPRLVVFTGGGLIRQRTLAASGDGVVNTHLGLLPPYRGMDVVEWPILEGHMEQVGLTVHFMSKGLDEGDILVMHRVSHEHADDIKQLRERLEVLMPQTCVHAVVRYLSGELTPRQQEIADGKQYFIMHPRLYDLALRRYQDGRTSSSVRILDQPDCLSETPSASLKYG